MNKKKEKNPLFAEVSLTSEEFQKSPVGYSQRPKFMKLIYPNGTMLILPVGISVSDLEQYIRIVV